MSDNTTAPPHRSAGRVAMAVVLTVALVVGTVAVAATVSDFVRSTISASTVTKVPTASGLSAKKQLSLKGKLLQGPLLPGVKRPLKVTLTNPLKQRLKVTAITVKPGKPAASGCLKSWVKATSFKASKKKKPIVVTPHGKAKVTLSVQLVNLSTVNQDSCKSTKIPLKLSATARQG